MERSYEMMKLAYDALQEKKGEKISVLDISDVSVIADYFLISHGENINQVQAMADAVQESLEKHGYMCRQVEGYLSGNWILLDFGEIVVHIFSKEERRFYDLERIWRDGKRIDMENESKKTE
ncbi:MAG: ribosome silencing factor [Lachnospiraceae bacterium]|nr:ribosome silencing factor [Lachnospiraceae bacterium]